MKKLFSYTLLLSLVVLAACSKTDVNDVFSPTDDKLELSATNDNASLDEGEIMTQTLFTIDNDKGELFENEALLLTNSSLNAVSYHWDFGNGDTSTEANPRYKYDMHGYYTVTLTITDAMGNRHHSSQEILVLCVFGGGDHDQ